MTSLVTLYARRNAARERIRAADWSLAKDATWTLEERLEFIAILKEFERLDKRIARLAPRKPWA